MASPINTVFSIVREAAQGVTPATPAFKTLEALPGSDLTLSGKSLTAETLRANRAVAGAAFVDYSAAGLLEFAGRRDDAVQMLIEAALCGPTTSGVIKGGGVDYSHTIEKKIVHDGNAFHFRYLGQQVSSMKITSSASRNVKYSFDFVGMNRTSGSAIITGATYTAPVAGKAYTALDVGTISIGGVAAVYTDVAMDITQAREAAFGLGTPFAVAVGASAQSRAVKITATLFRRNLDIDALAGTIVPVSVVFGSGTGNVTTISCPSMMMSVPTDQINGANLMVQVELTAVNDATLGSDVSFTFS